MALAAAWAFRHLGTQELLQDGIRRFVPFKVAAKGTEPLGRLPRPRHTALIFDALARSINVHHHSGPRTPGSFVLHAISMTCEWSRDCANQGAEETMAQSPFEIPQQLRELTEKS